MDSGDGARRLPVTLCMINHNGEAILEQSVGAAVARSHLFSRIIIVDNRSSDGSIALVKRLFPSVRIVSMDKNRGAAAARNRAWREAGGGGTILFIDNDVILEDGCVERLSAALDDHPAAVAAMPAVLYAADRERVQYDGADSHYIGVVSLRHAGRAAAELDGAVTPIGSLITACFLFDGDRWGKDEPFDDAFFIYLEDHDLGLRIRMRGGTILSVPAARCLHGEGAVDLSLRSTGRQTPLRIKELVRNRWQIIWKNYSAKTIVLLLPMFAIYEIAQIGGVIAGGWIGPYSRAATWFIRNLRSIARRRREAQRRRVVPDGELLTGGPLPFAGEWKPGGPERVARSLLDSFSRLYWRIIHRAV